MHLAPSLFTRGPYRVVASGHSGDDDRGYVVLDTAGTPLREEPGLDAARSWIERRIALDAGVQARPARPSASTARRLR
jgi:hypothetical protein